MLETGGDKVPMRICHIISGDLWAGAEVMCARLLSGLAEIQGLELSAILLNEGKLAEQIRISGIPLEVVDETRMGFLRITKRVHEILKERKPDIIHTHRLKENFLGYFSSRISDREIPLICTQHGLDEPKASAKWRVISKANLYFLSTRFNRVVAVSNDMRNVLTEKYLLPERKVVVIHNGTDPPVRNPPHPGNSSFVIGSAGRFFPVKDYPLFVDVCSEIHRHAKDIRFELAGEGPELERISEKIRYAGLQDVFCLKGFVEDMSSFYTGLDLYVNTSLHEGFPMSILEAMSHGLPIVAPKKGGIKEVVVDGLNGYLIEGRDSMRFAQKCLAFYKDLNLRYRMGIASREKITREYSIETMAWKYYELYSKVLLQTRKTNLSSGAYG